MKKIIILIILAGFLPSLVFAECTDSDGGKNYYKKGTTVGTYTADDVCLTGNVVPNQLEEHFCDSAIGHTFEIYTCQKGCSDGACTYPKCGDGYCDSITCSASGCPAVESAQNCPQDCVINSNCYSDGDCPSSNGKPYCDGTFACYTIQHYKCDKPGSSEAKCVSGGTDGNCNNCQNGCQNGRCIPNCIENWQCGSWSSCMNNQQTRTCTDLNNCGTLNSKPITSSSCNVGSGGGSSSGGGGGGSSSSSSSGGSGGGQGGGCFDTDGGKDYYKKGIAAGIWDSCISKYKLSERYCTENNEGADFTKECPLGFLCEDGSCVKSNEDDRKEESSTTTYFKSCSYVWDSSPYVGQKVKITASIKDSNGNTDSDDVEVEIVESQGGSGGSGHSMDGKILDIQINEPRSEKVRAGAVDIKISSKGPNELGDMSLGFSGENLGAGFPISNRNCVAGGSGSGGGSSGIGSTCKKYHTCKDGSEVQYCETIQQYDKDGNVVGAGCACKQNPEGLCTSPSSGGDGGISKPIKIPTTVGGGSGIGKISIICSGCVLGDKCVPIGYRSSNKYCNIEQELIEQKNDEMNCNNSYECKLNLCEINHCGKYCEGCKDKSRSCIPFGTRLENNKYCNINKLIDEQKNKESVCSNNYECISNLCVNSKCIDPSLIEKIIKWFKNLFG